MAFGITKQELNRWKEKVKSGEIAFLTHYWVHPRFPHCKTVTKVGCADIEKLSAWLSRYGLNQKYIHYRSDFPHFDLIGEKQTEILCKERLWEHMERFKIH